MEVEGVACSPPNKIEQCFQSLQLSNSLAFSCSSVCFCTPFGISVYVLLKRQNGIHFGTQSHKSGPGTYGTDDGSFSSTALQKKASSSSWAKSQEAARLTQMPHFKFKEICQQEKKRKLGPGTYNHTDFLQLMEKQPHSIRGICDTGAIRFKDYMRECYPGPGTYGNPYAKLQEREKTPVTAVGLMDSKAPKQFTIVHAGSGLGPGTYNIKNSVDEMLKRVVSIRGPYEIFTGNRSKPMVSGHFAGDVCRKTSELSGCNIKSFLDELETREKKKHGVFGTFSRDPDYPAERIFWSKIGMLSREQVGDFPQQSSGPIKRTEYKNQPPFWIGAKRFDQRAYRLCFGNTVSEKHDYNFFFRCSPGTQTWAATESYGFAQTPCSNSAWFGELVSRTTSWPHPHLFFGAFPAIFWGKNSLRNTQKRAENTPKTACFLGHFRLILAGKMA
uniref:Lymphocyte expansion molecule n=1 Tax=Laticauda laticaudata TaxID=8630 RepID=A0A8C5RQF0_LATLA